MISTEKGILPEHRSSVIDTLVEIVSGMWRRLLLPRRKCSSASFIGRFKMMIWKSTSTPISLSAWLSSIVHTSFRCSMDLSSLSSNRASTSHQMHLRQGALLVIMLLDQSLNWLCAALMPSHSSRCFHAFRLSSIEEWLPRERPVFRAVFHLFRNQPGVVASYIDQLLHVFAHVLDPSASDQLSDDIRAELLKFISGLNAKNKWKSTQRVSVCVQKPRFKSVAKPCF